MPKSGYTLVNNEDKNLLQNMGAVGRGYRIIRPIFVWWH